MCRHLHMGNITPEPAEKVQLSAKLNSIKYNFQIQVQPSPINSRPFRLKKSIRNCIQMIGAYNLANGYTYKSIDIIEFDIFP